MHKIDDLNAVLFFDAQEEGKDGYAIMESMRYLESLGVEFKFPSKYLLSKSKDTVATSSSV